MRSLRHTTLAALLGVSCATAPEPQPEESKLDPDWRPGGTRLPGSLV